MEKFPLIWIPLFPLCGALCNVLVGRSLPRRWVAWIGCLSVGGALAVSAAAIGQLIAATTRTAGAETAVRLTQSVFDWISVGPLHIEFGLSCDALTAVMLAVITVVGLLIHVFSTEYMHGDPSYSRFFAYLNLFMAAMLILVLGNNLVVLFVGWEGVGLCSYLLIGFWYDKSGVKKLGCDNASAGKKAFIVNRIGDCGVLIAMFLLFNAAGTLNFVELGGRAHDLLGTITPLGLGPFSVAAVAAFLLFVGATGKSAQIPLFVWLPDAMAGPTPVSALIHAATMVTAGVYMVARMNFLYMLTPGVMGLVAITGAVTAFFAATIGLAQTDIKKVLAYSTISQLGYMFMGVGVGAFTAGIFHVFTHAFFKACLFLGAGAVIHALGDQQDIRWMGGLRKRLPVTHGTFLIAALALAGIAPFAGFFSKDEILWQAFAHTNPAWPEWLPPVLFGLGLAAALCTALYVGRLYSLTFLGSLRVSRTEPIDPNKIHSPHKPMHVPLVLLAMGAAVVGLLGLPAALGDVFGFGDPERVSVFHRLLEPVVSQGHLLAARYNVAAVGPGLRLENTTLEFELMGLSLAIAIVGFAVGVGLYRKGPSVVASRLSHHLKPLYQLIAQKYYVDGIYRILVVNPFRVASNVFFRVVDKAAIDTVAVSGIAHAVDAGGWLARRAQSGNVQQYLAVFVIGLGAMVMVARAPTAEFSVSDHQVHVGQEVSFSAAASVAGSNSRLQYRWDFDGDGRWDMPAGPQEWLNSPTVLHTFQTAGQYRVRLRVRDPRWKSHRDNFQVIRVLGERQAAR